MANREDSKFMNITPSTVFELNKMLNYIKDNDSYIAQISNISIKYNGIQEDTYNGKREVFIIERDAE